MTVSSAIASASFSWTGVETQFAPGFQAQEPGDVSVTWENALGATGTLTLNTNFAVTLDGANLVTVAVIAFPAAPLTITIARNSTPLQADAFQDGVPWSADVIEGALDLATLRDQELRREIVALQLQASAFTAQLAVLQAALSLQQLAIFAANPASFPTSVPATAGTYWNDGGVLSVTPGGPNPLPVDDPHVPWALWNNYGVVCFSLP